MFKHNDKSYVSKMCGITGFIDFNGGQSAETLQNIAAAMAGKLAHRGPDHQGIWTDAARGVALAHRRLSIVDLSACGNQPMQSANSRYIIIYNGEIYNFSALKIELESTGMAPIWRGHSDTEVMLAAIQAWGLDVALQKFNGMFAFALYDMREQRLYLARDRFGEKPLYYGWQQNVFLFGSELKALTAHPAFTTTFNRDAIAALMARGNIPAPHSIYQNIFKLMPGQYVTLGLADRHTKTTIYWSALNIIETAPQNIFDADETSLVTQLDQLLNLSVKQRMVADVPLGAFLSGGIDSSLITALMQAHSTTPIKSFSIGFEETGYNEATVARAVAMYLGTAHTEFYVTSADAVAVIPQLPQMYDEPFADSSQLVTHLVAKLARQHVTVALTGDGGDELFGGYYRHTHGPRLWQYLQYIPLPLRRTLQKLIHRFPTQNWDMVISPFTGRQNMGSKLHKLAGLAAATDQNNFHQTLLSLWQAQIVKGASLPPLDILPLGNFTDTLMAQDTIDYLPNDILTKLDRATMAASLESRLPFLDPALLEFAWRLPQHLKIRGTTGKYILRKVLERYVPPALTERPKAGFAVPLAAWLRGPLKDWAQDLLSPAKLNQQNIFATDIITRYWQEHLTGRRDWDQQLWAVLMFQAWYREQHKG